MKLYLAKITQMIISYMEPSYNVEIQRLVWANDEEEAELKCEKEYTNDDQYGINKCVIHIELEEAL